MARRVTHVQQIAASQEAVFEAVAHIEQFKACVPDIVEVQFLTEQKRGVGTRFKETRMMGRRKATVTLEVTEYEAPSRVRIVSDEGGTVWDTVFSVTPAAGKPEHAVLEMVMDARPYKLMARLMNPIIMPLVRTGVSRDMEAVKRHCEAE